MVYTAQGAQLSSAIQAYNQKTTVDLSDMVLCVYDEVTGRFTFSRTNDRGVFKIGMETTMADLVGLAATQLDDPQTTIESAHAANLTPCSAMLVKLDISCDAIEAQSRGAGGGLWPAFRRSVCCPLASSWTLGLPFSLTYAFFTNVSLRLCRSS